MNVYSLRLIPSLKLKFCELLGIASIGAMDQLVDRVGSLERKMGQLDERLKRNGGRLLDGPFQALVSPRPKPKKKAAVSRRLKVTLPEVVTKSLEKRKTTRRIPPSGLPEGEGTIPANLVTLAQPPVEAMEDRPAVILVRQDAATQQAVRKYFGNSAEILRKEELSEVEEILEDREVTAVFFDRTLVGEAADREWLERLSARHPETAMVGLSNYLTLAIAEAVPSEDDWLTFLTKPLTETNLEDTLGRKGRVAIS
jgi:hypothetical protein